MRLPSAAFLLVVLLAGSDLSFGQTPTRRPWDIIERGHDSHSTKGESTPFEHSAKNRVIPALRSSSKSRSATKSRSMCYAWRMFEVLSKDYAGPVRVEAAQKLATG
jgi:hypothetical protein